MAMGSIFALLTLLITSFLGAIAESMNMTIAYADNLDLSIWVTGFGAIASCCSRQCRLAPCHIYIIQAIAPLYFTSAIALPLIQPIALSNSTPTIAYHLHTMLIQVKTQ
jgi:uncharacterized membrane protein (DUF4010 family)